MADIVQSLFGVTPELYQQAQAQRASEQALQYAQLSPFQQANYAIGRGGYQLAGALGGTDPQLQMISTRNSIAKQINYNDPNSIMQGVQMLSQAGDTVGAMQLADVARKMESEMAQRFQRTAAGQASLVQAAKDQAEIDNTKSQYAAFERLYPTAAAPAPAAAAPAPMGIVDQETGTVATPVAPQSAAMGTALPPVSAGAAAPVPAPMAAPGIVQGRGTLTQQISDLEKQQAALLSLPKVPAAKAQADVLGERIKDLRSQLKPTDIATLEREIAQLQAEGVADTDPRITNRLSKITKLVSSGAEQFGVDRESIALEVYDKSFAKLTQPERARVNQLLQANKRETAPRVSVAVKGEEAFATGRGKSQSDLLTEATSSARTATQALQGLNSMKQLNASGELFTGPLANPYLGAANLLASINLLSANQVGKLAKSEVYDKQAKDLVMADLGGKLGAQISDSDRKYVESRIPQLATSQKARTELLDKIEEIQRGKIDFYRKMNEHANQYGNLNTFDFSQSYAPVSTPAAPNAGFSIRRVN